MKTQLLAVLLALSTLNAPAQGFRNLDFEMANVSGASYFDLYGTWFVPFSQALPYWQGSGGAAPATAYYNGSMLDGSVVGLYSRTQLGPPASGFMPPVYLQTLTNRVIGGQFSALLMSDYDLAGGDMQASLWQTGLVPADANSLSFQTTGELLSWYPHTPASWDLAVFLNSQRLAVALQGFDGSVYTWAADIRAFAGVNAELKFLLRSTPYPSDTLFDWGINLGLDDMAFSSVVVPEPGGLGLWALLAAVVPSLCRRLRLAR
jgi:hypothetical protein